MIQQRKKNFLYMVLLIAGVTAWTGCDVNHSLDADKYSKVYMPQARNTPAEFTAITGIDTTQTITYGATYGGPDKPSRDISVTFTVDAAEVDSFNTSHGTSYPVLPENAYSLEKKSEIIPAGQSFTPELKLSIKGNVDINDRAYLLPVTMDVTTENVAVNENLKTAYFLITTNKVQPLHSDVIITGFMVNAGGADSPEKGTEKYDFTVRGGFEYIQLMALRDIDFSETPYSLVVGRHYHEHAKGWASGKDMSFKFNLTEGQAAKGTFFYVGGAGMRVDGYRSEGKSTDISDANWIRALQTNIGEAEAVAGDGFGWSTTGLLPNTDKAIGLAVFEGTDVTASSVPIDAVFYGSQVNGALKGTNGYRIPTKSDLYSAVDEATGDPQPLFGQGSNTFMVADAKDGNFIQLGGIFSEEAILKPRKTPNIYDTKIDTELDEIEGGQATQFQ